MHIERIRPAIFEVTLHAYELSALIATARWAVEGAEGELAPEALEQLEQVLNSYEESIARERRAKVDRGSGRSTFSP